MMTNVGSMDRAVRSVAGLAILGAGWYYGSWLGLIGLILIATAAIGWCPMYCPLGLTTCKGSGCKPEDKAK